ncbi:MAG: S8 family serine peptidase [Ktedonobacteraceae bacterium]
MDGTRMQMDPYMHNTFWYPDKITITFQFKPGQIEPYHPIRIDTNASDREEMGDGNKDMDDERRPLDFFFPVLPTYQKEDAVDALNVDGQTTSLNAFLSDNGYPRLSPIDITDTLRFPGTLPPARADFVGKYLFTSIDIHEMYVPTIIGFFKFAPDKVPVSSDDSNRNIDPVVRLVNFINEYLNEIKDEPENRYRVPIVSASPTWLVGSCDSRPVGCPLTPPIPVPAGTHCKSNSSLFPITLPDLPTDLKRTTGDGVHVFVLDTLPTDKDIRRAAQGAEEHNLLLLDVANNVTFHHNQLPVQIDEPNPFQPKTGKDIKGRNSGGFRMQDHGLFVAGIVRDIAPNSHVECVRVLNDFCAGDLPSLTKALESIHNRMLQYNPDDNYHKGDLFKKPVVVNLSLVIPDDGDVNGRHLNNLDLSRVNLLKSIQSLVDQGALIAASAGNEGDLRYPPANPMGIRPSALCPAAFAYNGLIRHNDRLIPVGAVDKNGNPASYSCYPGSLGIATFGGEVPQVFKQDKSGCYTKAEDIDAVIGIYTSLSYPSLLLEDCQPTYPVPNADAWAYWVGTSFSTPIISGVTARTLEYWLRTPGAAVLANTSVSQVLTNAGALRQITWTRLEPDAATAPGFMIHAVQKCECKDRDDDHEDKREKVDIHVTINERE